MSACQSEVGMKGGFSFSLMYASSYVSAPTLKP